MKSPMTYPNDGSVYSCLLRLLCTAIRMATSMSKLAEPSFETILMISHAHGVAATCGAFTSLTNPKAC